MLLKSHEDIVFSPNDAIELLEEIELVLADEPLKNKLTTEGIALW